MYGPNLSLLTYTSLQLHKKEECTHMQWNKALSHPQRWVSRPSSRLGSLRAPSIHPQHAQPWHSARHTCPSKLSLFPTSTMCFQQCNPCVANLPWKIGRGKISNYGLAPCSQGLLPNSCSNNPESPLETKPIGHFLIIICFFVLFSFFPP